jgi:UDP-glucose 4-epimerase
VILVTGGAGFIGSHTLVVLLMAGRSVVCVDNFVNSSPKSLEAVRALVGSDLSSKLHFVEADVSDAEAMAQVFEQFGSVISHVIHFCGLKSVFESRSNPVEYYRDNIDSVLVVLRLMDAHEVHRIIFSSSATVYGPRNLSPLVETMRKLEPTNPYGRTKLFIEEILHDKSASDPKFQAVLLRYFNPIGAHPSGLIGESPQGVPNNLMPYILQVAVGKLKELEIFGDDYDTKDGTGERDFIHVMDLAEGHVAALKIEESGAHVFNLGTGRPSSVKQLLSCFERAAGKSIATKVVPRRPGDLGRVYADVKKAREVLKWKTKRSLVDSCRDGWKWQLEHPGGF